MMEEDLTCSVCSEVFEGGVREPVVLPQCGHTFCRPCLLNLQGMHHTLRCPTCRRRHKGASVVQLPANFAVLNLAVCSKQRQEGLERCGRHGDPLRLWCRPCREPLCGQCLFEGHMMDGHHVVKIHAIVKEKKRNIEEQTAAIFAYVEEEREALAREMHSIAQHLATIHSRSTRLTAYVTDVNKILKDVRKSSRIISVLANENSLESLSSQLGINCNEKETGQGGGNHKILTEPECYETLPPHLPPADPDPSRHSSTQTDTNDNVSRSLELVDPENNNFCVREKDVDGLSEASTDKGEEAGHGSYSTEEQPGAGSSDTDQDPDDGSCRGGRLGRVGAAWPLAHCAPAGSPRWPHINWTHFINQLPVVQLLVPPEKPEVFLQLGVGERNLGRVHIRLWGHLRRAQHFLALCLGTLGPSYKGSRFSNVARRGEPGECLVGGRYMTEGGGSSAKGLFEGLEWRGRNSGPVKEGLLGGASDGDPSLEAFFGICTRDYQEGEYYCPFGRVVAGMDVVQDAVSHDPVSQVTITDITLASQDCIR